MISKHLISKLNDFGLNTYEARLWVALLSRGVSTAGELSDIANVPRSRSYDVLESLEKKGFIIMKIGKPIKYIVVPPSEVIERVKKGVKEQAEAHALLLDGLKESTVLHELNTLHSQGVELIEPSDLTGSFRGRQAIYNHLEMLIKSAEDMICVITSEDELVYKADRLKDALSKAKAKGVKVRIAAPITEKNRHAGRQLSTVADVRCTQDVASRLCIVDQKEVVFMLFDDASVHPSYDTGVWANTSFFASSLQVLFDREWEKLKPAKLTT